MTSKAIALFCALFLAALPAAQAQLTWDKTEIELHPKPGEKETVAKFKYENKGKTTVNITNVRSSCGCTVATLEKKDVAPGEKGEITATFNIGNRTGTQSKMVSVETDHPEQPKTDLVLKAVIPEIIALQPTFVYWESGEAPEPKKITLRAGKDIPVTKVDVTSKSPDFTTKVEKGSAPGEFIISVTPKDTTRLLSTTLTIKPDYPKTLYAAARVTAPVAGR